MKFLNPYQFIPVDTRDTKTVTWNQREDLETFNNHFLRHDYWHAEGFSGRITCELKCVSPVVVGGQQFPGKKDRPGVVKPYRHPDGSLAIPGASLRGMIGSVTEIISQSSLRVLASKEDTVYSQRKPANRGLKKIGILLKEANEWRIYPLAMPIRVADYNHNNDPDTAFVRGAETFHNEYNRQFVYADIETDAGSLKSARNLRITQGHNGARGILYIRGQHDNMPNKRRECFIPWHGESPKKPIPVDEAVVGELANMLRLRYQADSEFPQLPQGYKRRWDEENVHIVESGDLLYYRTGPDGKVCELSYSSIWRAPVKGNLYDALERSGGKNALPWNPKRTQLTPAEWLFGITEENPGKNKAARNIVSRVRFTDAAPDCELELGAPLSLKILASPKPPCPSMYFTGRKGQYIPKSKLDLNNAAPNGRKVYLRHGPDKDTWESKIPDKDNLKPYLSCEPIAKESVFRFYIHFENLSSEELGLLRTALEPNANFVHRLGLGKPLGLGHVAIRICKIERIDRKNRYSPESLRQALRYMGLTEAPDTALVNQNALELLTKLGVSDPGQSPVCYPFSSKDGQKEYNEKEGFKWFVENNRLKSGNDYLEKIRPDHQALPTLDSSQGPK